MEWTIYVCKPYGGRKKYMQNLISKYRLNETRSLGSPRNVWRNNTKLVDNER
jgi:hypothetical protein